MGTASVRRGWFGGRIVSAVLSFGVLGAAASAQDVVPCAAAPVPPTGIAASASPVAPVAGAGSEAERLDRLVARLADRRSVLDRRREELASERARLLTVDRPADEADIMLWRKCEARGGALEKDVNVLRALATSLTSEALEQVPIPETSVAGAFKPDVGWARTKLQVALRSAPESAQKGMQALEADTLVARLASAGGWERCRDGPRHRVRSFVTVAERAVDGRCSTLVVFRYALALCVAVVVGALPARGVADADESIAEIERRVDAALGEADEALERRGGADGRIGRTAFGSSTGRRNGRVSVRPRRTSGFGTSVFAKLGGKKGSFANSWRTRWPSFARP